MILLNRLSSKKCALLISSIICIAGLVSAQNVGINTPTPHPNAVLDITGVNKGLLIPRGDLSSRTALSANTAKGLMFCDTTTNTLWIHNGNGLMSGWHSVSSGTNHWTLNGALGTEITNTNGGGFWSANGSIVLSDPGPVLPPVSGPGTRLMWIPEKSAFRAGTTDAGHWDAPSIGLFSFAGGVNAIASSSYAFAMGAGTTSKGLASTALGWFTIANGDITTSLGFRTKARSYASVAIGRWNDSLAVSNQATWIDSDPLFMIGNGTSEAMRHNAMVVYKNGNLVLKSPEPFYELGKLPVEYEIPITGEGTRMMWLPEMSAFRVGTVTDTAWDSEQMGIGSFATGFNAIASGDVAVAMGVDTRASDFSATAFGKNTRASGIASTAMGNGTMANGENSTSMGSVTIASGFNTTSLGFKTHARSYGSMAIGRHNDGIATSDSTAWVSADPLLILGNGTSEASLHNTLVVYKNGNIISKAPTAITTDPGILPIPVNGAGTRMMWLPEKGAFRAGTVEGEHWDGYNIGTNSFAVGAHTTASGLESVAMGTYTVATSINSIAMGYGSLSSGYASVSMGIGNTASGSASFASGTGNISSGEVSASLGISNIADGNYSTTIGRENIAKSVVEMVIGQYNDTLLATNPNRIIWEPNDGLLIVGNGTGPGVGERHNAFVIYKNGNTEIDGYTELGNDSPKIKMKKLAGTSSSTQNTWVDVTHGLTMSKIISVDIILSVPGFSLPPSYTYNAGYEYQYYISPDHIRVVNSAANSSSILSKAFTILITYEE